MQPIELESIHSNGLIAYVRTQPRLQLSKVRLGPRHRLRTFLKKRLHVGDTFSPEFLSTDVPQVALAQPSQIYGYAEFGNFNTGGLDG